MTPPEPILRARELTKRYGDHVVLDAIDLEIAPGEKVAIIGPSGSGKSTLLRVVMTLERPDGGDVEIDGEPVFHETTADGRARPASEAHLRRMRGHVGMVFQQFNLFPHLTALDNVACAPRLVRGRSRAESEAQGRALLQSVGLGDKIDAWPASLSGGQKQRVAIARALALEPRIMLFDEITSALDPERVGEVLDVLRALAERGGTTMLIVTHELGFAREAADRVLFFDEGRIVEEGPAAKLLDAPREERTKAFLDAVLHH